MNTGLIKIIETKGIYVNITLGDTYSFSSLNRVLELGENYGESDIYQGESIVVDYSSPNTAKHLHAGHIRSTIIGHILGNLYEATGNYVHRVNHINDWGGFGYLIEGYIRWKKVMPKFETENDMLFHIYTIYRRGEKIAESQDEYNKLSTTEGTELQKYYGNFSSYQEFVPQFKDFIKGAKMKFTNLENGEKEEVALWKTMVSWSMKDFEKFYNVLGIHQDYVLGESFYGNMGKQLIDRLESTGMVVFYDSQKADKDIQKLYKDFNGGIIQEKEFLNINQEIEDDIGCYLVPLPDFERFVVLKADKSTIYATRDIAAIKYRAQIFNPSRIVYEVGQEQAEHFDKLFKSAQKIGIDTVSFAHIYHGFYVDSNTKKKLSSRDGASNVQQLISDSIQYFADKYKQDDRGLSQSQIQDISYKLAIGSIVFNDIRKDKKSPVLLSRNITDSCKSFEESGGAYVMYSICRANSILNRSGEKDISITNLPLKGSLEGIEKTLINEVTKYPTIVLQSAQKDNPAILTTYLSNLARNYNSYYNSCPVIQDNGQFNHRLVITKSVSQVLVNGMKLCHIDVPEKI